MKEIETLNSEIRHGIHKARDITFKAEGKTHSFPWVPVVGWDDHITGSLVKGGELFTTHLTGNGDIRIEASNGEHIYEVEAVENYE